MALHGIKIISYIPTCKKKIYKKNIVARKKKKAQQKQKLAARQENVKTTVSLQLFKGKINGIVSVLITA